MHTTRSWSKRSRGRFRKVVLFVPFLLVLASVGFTSLGPSPRPPRNCPSAPGDELAALNLTMHRREVLKGCGEVCDTTTPVSYEDGWLGTSLFGTPIVRKHVDCEALWANSAIDQASSLAPRSIPAGWIPDYTMNGRVPIACQHEHSVYLGGEAIENVWTREVVDTCVAHARDRTLEGTYGQDKTTEACDRMERMAVAGKSVLVVGSERPWLECCALAAGASHVTVLEYGRIRSEHPQISTLTPEEARSQFLDRKLSFDVVATFSSLEHSGLGRYGDALNPFGDLQAVARAWCVTKPGGQLFLNVPAGKDCLVWNAHRVYGSLRLPHLYANWRPVESLHQLWRDVNVHPLQMWFRGWNLGEHSNRLIVVADRLDAP
mmetsp:Transcript_21109/g.49404  ORF Transcript_21109/g.49404 Transcript_21109/m.49404 type:complete len:376 (-) Transcript_21109:253-1380(-)